MNLRLTSRFGSGLLKDRDDTGDDLNLIVMLTMAALRYKSAVSTQAAAEYSKSRADSYGSFLGEYRHKYGVDITASAAEIRARPRSASQSTLGGSSLNTFHQSSCIENLPLPIHVRTLAIIIRFGGPFTTLE